MIRFDFPACFSYMQGSLLLSIFLGLFVIVSHALPQSINEQNAYSHLYEVMDKYHRNFDVYTEQGAGGNHYVPSGWMGDVDNVIVDDSWTVDPYSGDYCMRIAYSADFFNDNHYIPSGWLGDYEDITFDGSCADDPYSGETCVKIEYSALGSQGNTWAGIYWQYPENNWGDKESGYDLSGAKRLTFWAKGEKGGEKGEFKLGGINRFPYHDDIMPYQDSCDSLSTGIVTLSDEWNQYSIDLVTTSYFEIYTDKDAGGKNHYTPSGWYNGSGNMTLDDDWGNNPHSGSSCIKVTWDGTSGDDDWQWNGVSWQQPEANWNGNSGLGYDLTGATKLTFYARTDAPELEVEFLVGYPGDSSGEVSIGWQTLYTSWTKYEIDLSGRDLSDMVCGFAFLFNDVHDPDPDGCTFYLDDIRFDKVIEKDLSHIIGGFCWVTNAESNPDGCTFYLDDIRYEYDDKNFNVYTDAQHNWVGIYWQYPDENWGDDPGHDLTGATRLTFWAKGDEGGEKMEFKAGGINRAPYNDLSKPYQDSFGPVTTGVIILTDTWQQYTIYLTGEDLSSIIGGLCWVTNNTQNPDGCIFYLDDMRYDKELLDQLRLLLSFETISTPDDKYVSNMASIYDNALAMLALIARGTQEDWTRARTIGDSFVFCQNYDRYFNDGRLRNAYQSGDIADGITGKARLPGWWDDQEGKWLEDEEQAGSHTGNMAWAMIALLRYHKSKGEPSYLDTATLLGQWIVNNCYDTRGPGGYIGGYNGWRPNTDIPSGQMKLLWKSTEHNIDVYVAFMMLYEATGNSFWLNHASHARSFVEVMWDPGENHFWTGTSEDGITINKAAIPLDAQTWGVMSLRNTDKYSAGITWVEENCLVDPHSASCDFEGFDFNTDMDGIWFEGTAQMCVAYQIMNEYEKSDKFIGEIRKAQTSASNNNGKGIVAACHDNLSTGFSWIYNNRLHVGATAWYIFAERGYNPYWPDVEPVVEFTYVPPCGSVENLKGKVSNIIPADHKVAVYIRVDNGWWIKPYWAQPLTHINGDGTWTCDITTGGHDQDATEIAAYLVSDGYDPPLISGQCSLPEELDTNSVANAQATRSCGYRQIQFSGYNWRVKSSAAKLEPGPNYFSDSEENVWVDDKGRLHLRIAKRNDKWYCPEVILQQSFGYGKYSFHIANRVDDLNENVVLGLFTWDECSDPVYGNREIDIEVARWGNAGNNNTQFVVQPYNLPGNMHRFDMQQSVEESIHSFTWHEDNIEFQSTYNGFHESWVYTGGSIPKPDSENSRINLWLFGGIPPSDDQEVEVIIERFEYVGDIPSDCTMEMKKGWNLISLPIQPLNTSIESVLSSIVGKYRSVWGYEPNPGWHWYLPENTAASNLFEMEACIGYWIDMEQSGTLTITEWEPPETTIRLSSGWNLVGHCSLETSSIEACMSSIERKYNSVWGYSGQWRWYLPANPGASNLWSIEPWYGFWIEATEDCIWDCASDVNEVTTPAAPPISAIPKREYVPSGKPEIPYIIWGTVEADGMRIRSDGDYVVVLKVDGKVQSSYRLGTVTRYVDLYVLDVLTTTASSARGELCVQMDGTQVKASPVPPGRPGQIIRLDLSIQLPPKVSMLHQNYPNPFNPDTWIPYQLNEYADVMVKIYAATGQLVRTLSLGHKPAGFYTDKGGAVYWDGRNEAQESVASGIYFYSIQASDFTATKKMIIMK